MMSNNMKAAALTAVLAGAGFTGVAHAQDAAAFYAGKNISIIGAGFGALTAARRLEGPSYFKTHETYTPEPRPDSSRAGAGDSLPVPSSWGGF